MRLPIPRPLQAVGRLLTNGARANEKQLINQGMILAALNAARPGLSLRDAEFRAFSQWGEDGIIQHLTRLVPILHRTFVEFGVETFDEANCRFLMMKDDWCGLVIDGDPANVAAIRAAPWYWRHDLVATCAFIDRDNIAGLIDARGFGTDIGLLSVDIDGNDYWVLSALGALRPRIVFVEYNAIFGAERAISVPYDPGFQRTVAHSSNLYFGASLAAFAHWGIQNGYSLVGTNSNGVNAFFVREDIRPAALPALSVAEAFNDANHRQSVDAEGRLTYLSGGDRLAAIAGLPVVDVISGRTETL